MATTWKKIKSKFHFVRTYTHSANEWASEFVYVVYKFEAKTKDIQVTVFSCFCDACFPPFHVVPTPSIRERESEWADDRSTNVPQWFCFICFICYYLLFVYAIDLKVCILTLEWTHACWNCCCCCCCGGGGCYLLWWPKRDWYSSCLSSPYAFHWFIPKALI